MLRILFLALCGLLLGTTSASAQKNKKKAKTTIKKPAPEDMVPAEVSDEVKMLFDAYKFEEASELIEDEIEEAESVYKTTGKLEAMLDRVRIGQNMLDGTEKVIFVDSMVVRKSDLLSAIKLNKSCGQLLPFAKAAVGVTATNEEVKNSVAYLNEFQDLVITSEPDKKGFNKLFQRIRLSDNWSAPTRLLGLGDSTDVLAYPYLMSDGQTLYFAAKDANSLGGYDIYVTRYDSDTKTYLKAENIGMPFNSPANDYLYVIDEEAGLGWFATDRNQPEGKVCIYVFIPAESRNNYNVDLIGEERLIGFAKISSIKATQTDKAAVEKAKKQLTLPKGNAMASNEDDANRFVVTNGIVYHTQGDFKSAKAAQLFAELLKSYARRSDLEETLKHNRRQWSARSNDANLKKEILKEENELQQLDYIIDQMEQNIRKEEISALTKK